MEVFAIDLGNKQTKMVSSKTLENEVNGCKIFPSVFSFYDDIGQQVTVFGRKKQVSKYHTSKDLDFEYAWGKDINKIKNVKLMDTLDFTTNRYDLNEFRLLATFALGELAKDFEEAKNGILEVKLVTGIPSRDYNEEAVKKLMKVFLGDHQVSVDDVSYNIRVKDVHVMNQPIGSIYNQMLDFEGNVVDSSYLSETITVVDIGGGTFIVDTLNEMQLDNSMSGQENTGAIDLYQNIVTDCAKNGIALSVYDVEEILRNGNENIGYFYRPNTHESIDITQNVKKAIKKYTIERINRINAFVKNTRMISRFLMTGGGSNLVNREEFEKSFKYVQFIDNPETANPIGFYKAGIRIQLEETHEEIKGV